MSKMNILRIENIKIMAAAAVFMLILCSCGASQGKDQSSQSESGASEVSGSSAFAYTHLEAEEAKKMIESGECILIDTRGKPQYDYERIPGAVNLPVDSSDDVIKISLPDKDAVILLYCDYGGLSKQMAEHLSTDMGYSNIYEFDGLLVWEGELEGDKYN